VEGRMLSLTLSEGSSHVKQLGTDKGLILALSRMRKLPQTTSHSDKPPI